MTLFSTKIFYNYFNCIYDEINYGLGLIKKCFVSNVHATMYKGKNVMQIA